jgi:multidrug efflux pump subunit AcrA (membrane-fusion protein)
MVKIKTSRVKAFRKRDVSFFAQALAATVHQRTPPVMPADSALPYLIIYSFIFGDNSSKLNVETEKITIATLAAGPFQEFIPVTGNVLPIKTIYLDAVEGGRVEKKFIEAGSMVKEGDEILLLTNTNLLLDIMFREAQFFEQSNNLRNTQLLMEQSRLNLRQQRHKQPDECNRGFESDSIFLQL